MSIPLFAFTPATNVLKRTENRKEKREKRKEKREKRTENNTG
jgi:hypothetical protein